MLKYEDDLRIAKALAKTEPDKAMRICNDILNEQFDEIPGQMALFMIAYIMMQAERYGLAYQMYKRCEALNPNLSEIYSNIGMCLEEYDSTYALRMFQKASQLNPKNAHAYANEGLIQLQSGNPARCVELCDKALSIDPELRAATHNKGLAQLMLREWRDGWKNYFNTLGVKHREKRNYGLPEWNGEAGKVLVYGEQGVGDEIMFASCIPDLMRTNKVVIDCDKRLLELFKRSFDCPVYGTRFSKECLWVENEKPDYQCAVGQLPHFFRNSEEDFPGTPYLKANSESSLMWRSLFDTFKGKKVGIAWRGGLPNTGMKRRSLELADFEPLLDGDNTYISLEYKHVEPELLANYGIKSYPRVTAKGSNIDELAAMIGELDYVITACTTVVYICGALGVPCHVLVPESPGYRYHTSGAFPWYNSVSLYRQKNGVWPIKKLAEQINKREQAA